MTKTPDENSTTVELLECIDDALRNGRLMTRANLAFDYLLKRLDLTREDLPAYVEDIARIDAEDDCDHQSQCCRTHGTHSSPHIGCILR